MPTDPQTKIESALDVFVRAVRDADATVDLAVLLRTAASTCTDLASDVGRRLPPIQLSKVRGMANGDNTLEGASLRFMRCWFEGIDTTLLDRNDFEKWSRIRGEESGRFQVREWEGTRYVVVKGSGQPLDTFPDDVDPENGFIVSDKLLGINVPDTVTNEWSTAEDFASDLNDGGPWFYVVDTNTLAEDVESGTVFEDEADAKILAFEKNEENEGTGYGFPFAQHYGWKCSGGSELPDDWLEDLEASGFVVYEYTSEDGDTCIIAGIDGGGYSFTSAHYAPLYARNALRNDLLIETNNGQRRVTNEPEAPAADAGVGVTP